MKTPAGMSARFLPDTWPDVLTPGRPLFFRKGRAARHSSVSATGVRAGRCRAFLLGWAALAAAGALGSLPLHAKLTGLWEFEQENVKTASVGGDLGLLPHGYASYFQEWPDKDGVSAGRSLRMGFAYADGTRLFLRVPHGIGANGAAGAARINQYTLVFDLYLNEPITIGTPDSVPSIDFPLYQTDPQNKSPAQYFVHYSDPMRAYYIEVIHKARLLGRDGITYSPSLPDQRWRRVVVTADLEAKKYLTYVNGALFHAHKAPAADGEYALDPEYFLVGADNAEEQKDAPVKLGLLAVYDTALTSGEVQALGRPDTPIPHNKKPALSTARAGDTRLAAGVAASYKFTPTDPEGEKVQIQVDWGDGTPSPWTPLERSGKRVTLEHAWSARGKYVIKARARDAQEEMSQWVEIQNVTVTAPPPAAMIRGLPRIPASARARTIPISMVSTTSPNTRWAAIP